MSRGQGESVEEAVSFTVEGATLRGVLHCPSGGNGDSSAIVFLHGWSGYRIGPHRMFVKAARRYAQRGCHCLRFDYRGRGDSDGATGDATIASMIADTERAIAFLEEKTAASHVTLIGMCSGGKVAIGAARASDAVDRLILWSGELIGAGQEGGGRKSAFVLREYVRKLFRRATWRKIFAGAVNMRMVRRAVLGNLRRDVDHGGGGQTDAVVQASLPERLAGFAGRVLFIYGGGDPESPAAIRGYRRIVEGSSLQCDFHTVDRADHSFYSIADEEHVLSAAEDWLFA